MEVASLSIGVDSSQVRTAKKDLEALATSGLTLEGVIKKLGAAFAAYKLADYAKEAVVAAARYETLGIVMQRVGINIGYTGQQMNSFAASLQKTGISMTESRSTLTQMAGAQMDLTKASQLARIAQDAAVIGNINSSDAFQRMVHGIRSGETEVLRTIGINVQFDASYQKIAGTLHKTVGALTDTEKRTARQNAVVEYGTKIAGAYEASMQTMGKQILSAQRYADDLAVSIGAILQPMAALIVSPAVAWLKEASEGMKKFVESADGKKFIADLVNPLSFLVDVLKKVASGLGSVIGWLINSKAVMVTVGAAVWMLLVTPTLAWVSAQTAAGVATVMSIARTVALTFAISGYSVSATAATLTTGALTAASTALGVSMGTAALAAGAIGAALLAAYFIAKPWFDEMEKEDARSARLKSFVDQYITPMIDKATIVNNLKREVLDLRAVLKAAPGGKPITLPETAEEQLAKQKARTAFLNSATGAGYTDAQIDVFTKNEKKLDEAMTAQTALRNAATDAVAKHNLELKKADELRKRIPDAIKASNQELHKEVLLLTQGESAAYKYGLAVKLYGAAQQDHANSQRTELVVMKERKRLEDELFAAGHTEVEIYERKMRISGDLSEQEIKRNAVMLKSIERVKELTAAYHKAVEADNEAIKTRIANDRELADARGRDLLDAVKTVNRAADPLHDAKQQLDEQYAQLAMVEKQAKAMGTYDKALQTLKLSELQLRAEAGETWAIMGAVVVSSSYTATDAMVGWMNNVDGLGRTWKTLGNTIRNVIADMIVQMQKAIVQQQLMKPLMAWAGSAMGFSGSPSAAPAAAAPSSAGGSVTWSAIGGPVMPGANYIVGEDGPELFTSNVGGSISTNNSLRKSSGSGGETTITSQIIVNVAADGSATTTTKSSDANALASAIQRNVEPMVLQVIQKHMRPGGKLNPTSGGGGIR